MDVFGSFSLLLAFVCALYAFIGGIAAIYTRHPLLIKSTRQAGIVTCVLIFCGTISLEYLLYTDNFSMAYVVAHSNRNLSSFYKFAALWAGQEGSLLFWSCLLSVYVISVLIAYRNKNGELMPYVGVVLAGVQIFFLTLNNFVESPFKALGTVNASGALEMVTRSDGNGLNPLLQYPEMVIHPPNLYSGYTGLGLRSFGLGRLLGLGSSRKRFVASLAHRHRLPSLRDDAGKARHDEGLERMAGLLHLPALYPWHIPDAQRRGQLRSRFRQFADRPVVRRLHGRDLASLLHRLL
jgi:cytochrome c biogenesis factor